MRSFIDYVIDNKQNRLFNFAKSYAKPDHFMSFTEATWTSKNSAKVPNGITAFPISQTLHRWKQTNQGMQFDLVREGRIKLYILEANQTSAEYTMESFEQDCEALSNLMNEQYLPNSKLLTNLERSGLAEEIYREKNKFKCLIEDSTGSIHAPDKKLWELTRWLAAHGKNPNEGFHGNATQRWTNILRKLGYTAFVMEDIALFLDVSAFEVIDEIGN